MYKVFVDGAEGTTGLKIFERFSHRKNIELLSIDPELRKDEKERAKLINSSDVTFLCLPDKAATEAVKLVENPNTIIIDTSTAHRTDPDWTYGFSELSEEHLKNIKASKRIANPGCHATGFISLVYPLVKHGVLEKDSMLTCFSITGYSGGGKKMIASYKEVPNYYYYSPRQYGLNQSHKHLPEMKKVCELVKEPFFSPVVSNYYSGMEVSVFLEASALKGGISSVEKLIGLYKEHYAGSKLISIGDISEMPEQQGFIAANMLSGKDTLKIFVNGNEDRIVVTSVFDNLGKGASGAAIQNMNLSLGLEETAGLVL